MNCVNGQYNSFLHYIGYSTFVRLLHVSIVSSSISTRLDSTLYKFQGLGIFYSLVLSVNPQCIGLALLTFCRWSIE